jgi:hypothetical protein
MTDHGDSARKRKNPRDLPFAGTGVPGERQPLGF